MSSLSITDLYKAEFETLQTDFENVPNMDKETLWEFITEAGTLRDDLDNIHLDETSAEDIVEVKSMHLKVTGYWDVAKARALVIEGEEERERVKEKEEEKKRAEEEREKKGEGV